MRTKTALLALVTIAASALPLGAAQAQAKIGVVNVARLLQESPQAQAASQSLEGEFANRKRELQTIERDLKTREEKLTKDGVYGYGMRGGAGCHDNWGPFVLGGGASFDKGGMVTEKALAANRWFVDLAVKHKVVPPSAPTDGHTTRRRAAG